MFLGGGGARGVWGTYWRPWGGQAILLDGFLAVPALSAISFVITLLKLLDAFLLNTETSVSRLRLVKSSSRRIVELFNRQNSSNIQTESDCKYRVLHERLMYCFYIPKQDI